MTPKEKAMEYFRDIYDFYKTQKHHNGYLEIKDVERTIDIALEEQAKEIHKLKAELKEKKKLKKLVKKKKY